MRRRDGQMYDLSLIFNFRGQGRHELANNTGTRLYPFLQKDISSTKAGPIVEGIGEFADIATLTATNKWLVGGANLLALLARSADVTLGSFPQFSFDADGYGRPVPRFWGAEWMEHPEHKDKMWGHFVSLLTNQAGKFWDIFRAGNRIKNAKLIAWYNKTKLSKKKRWYLYSMQLIHAAVLLGSMVMKSKCAYANRHYTRYKYLIAEAVVSLIRRLHMRYLQSKMLNDARDEWAIEGESEESS